jgi:hypothetical protein
MDVGGNPTVVFDSIRNQVVLHFNRGMTDPQNVGSYDCIPAVDNFQITSQDDGLTWSDVKNISSFLEGYLDYVKSQPIKLLYIAIVVCCLVQELGLFFLLQTASCLLGTTLHPTGKVELW